MFITTELLKDFHSAVNYALDMSRNYANFFIDTTFGVIPVEMNCRDKGIVVVVEDWATCSITNFVKHNRHNKYDKIVRINYINGQHSELTKLEFAWAFSYILAEKVCSDSYCMDIKKYADALCLQYMRTYYMSTDPHAYAEWYIAAHNKFAKFNNKNYAMLLQMTTQTIHNRMRDAEKFLDTINEAIRSRDNSYIYPGDYGNDFYDTVMAVYAKHHPTFTRETYLKVIKGLETMSFPKVHVMDLINYIITEEEK